MKKLLINMRKLLIIKKQKEFDKKIEDEEKGFSINEEYKRFNKKDIEIVFNDKKILTKALQQIDLIKKNNFWVDFKKRYNPVKIQSLSDSMFQEYLNYIFELKKHIDFKIDINLFINIAKFTNIIYFSKKYKIGNKLISKIEELDSIKEIIKTKSVNSMLELNKEDLMYIDNSLSYNLSLKGSFHYEPKDIDLKKEFTINRIQNF